MLYLSKTGKLTQSQSGRRCFHDGLSVTTWMFLLIQESKRKLSVVTPLDPLRRVKTPRTSSLRFVDLFAGLGGFHLALSRLGHRCVLACEIDVELQSVYLRNFGLQPLGDIRSIDPADIPSHDILCAGFPCQPFSKAGAQLGTDCPEYGDLASKIVAWLRFARPQYFILENVPNLVRHQNGRVWKHFSTDLRQAGYDVRFNTLSPHEFGVPQIRERLYVVGARHGLDDFRWPKPTNEQTDIKAVLDSSPVGARYLSSKAVAAIEAWARFTELFPKNQPKPYFPIWAAEFGATYPFATVTPMSLPASTLREYRGTFGVTLADLRGKALADALPPYSRARTTRFPAWKVRFIQQNRDLYMRNRSWIDPWKDSLSKFEHSFQKLEWNYDRTRHTLWDTVIQLRGSGIRAKSPASAPALVAMCSTQTPVIGWERRYMTASECARLQGLETLIHLPAAETVALRALGNAVNATVTELIAERLLASARVAARPKDVQRLRA